MKVAWSVFVTVCDAMQWLFVINVLLFDPAISQPVQRYRYPPWANSSRATGFWAASNAGSPVWHATSSRPLPRDLAGRVEALISRQLTNPQCTINLIAGQLAMHPRTLQRRLQEDGVRFDTLLDNVRKARAADYLAQRDMHLITVTQLLGYTRQTSLNQSCLRWFGCSPLQFRKQAIGGTAHKS